MSRILSALVLLGALTVGGAGTADARAHWGGGHHTVSHGGHYHGGHGSSHRGGHYHRAATHHYGTHR
jgi:hypothetical protein